MTIKFIIIIYEEVFYVGLQISLLSLLSLFFHLSTWGVKESRGSGREGETLFRFHLNLDVHVDGDGDEWQQWR